MGERSLCDRLPIASIETNLLACWSRYSPGRLLDQRGIRLVSVQQNALTRPAIWDYLRRLDRDGIPTASRIPAPSKIAGLEQRPFPPGLGVAVAEGIISVAAVWVACSAGVAVARASARAGGVTVGVTVASPVAVLVARRVLVAVGVRRFILVLVEVGPL